MIDARRQHDAFTGGDAQGFDTGSVHVLGYVRYHGSGPLVVLANFSEQEQRGCADLLHAQGLSWPADDMISGRHVALDHDVTLGPYQLMWLRPA